MKSNETRDLLLVVIANEGKVTGYDIAKIIKPFVNLVHQVVYKTLKRMEAEGLIVCEHVTQDGKPDKKVYSLAAEWHGAVGDQNAKCESDFTKTSGSTRYARLAITRKLDDKTAYIRAMKKAEREFFRGLE